MESPVLVVDDYEDARATLREMVESLGLPVVEAANGQEALDFLTQRPEAGVQLILLDLDMPRMSGWELLKLLKSYVRLASIPVVVVSRHASHLSSEEARRLAGSFQAPYEIPRLKAMVEALVSH
ncbi:MAG: response regulator [Polyangiaceae bacterium]|jgi:CheY-like chemotaxis protein|nr:response regulator [Polyangiaceae bacterium]